MYRYVYVLHMRLTFSILRFCTVVLLSVANRAEVCHNKVCYGFFCPVGYGLIVGVELAAGVHPYYQPGPEKIRRSSYLCVNVLMIG